jgi:integrase
MKRTIHRLNARLVAALNRPGRHADGAGLYLVVDPSGAKRWAFLFRRQGRLREMGLGGLNSVSLAMARERAAESRKMLGSGGDPILKRKASVNAAPTFGAFADQFVETKAPGWRSAKHTQQWRRAITQHAAPLRRRPVDEITTEDVLAVLKPMWTEKPETASRLRARIEQVLDAARAAGHRSGENPARWRGHLDQLLSKRLRIDRGHFAALPYPDVPAFVTALRERPPGPAALALEFLILTAARSGEARAATWDEIDVAAAIWIIPPARMKAGREHRVPLSDRALEVLADAKKLGFGELVFPGERPHRPVSEGTWRQLLHRMNVSGVTVHGFRSAFRDWCGDATSFPREVAESALAHAVGDETEQAYRRSDALTKRRKLMDAWARFCTTKPAIVVPFAKSGGGS